MLKSMTIARREKMRAMRALAALPMDQRYKFVRRWVALEQEVAVQVLSDGVGGPGRVRMEQAVPHFARAVEALEEVEAALFFDCEGH